MGGGKREKMKDTSVGNNLTIKLLQKPGVGRRARDNGKDSVLSMRF